MLLQGTALESVASIAPPPPIILIKRSIGDPIEHALRNTVGSLMTSTDVIKLLTQHGCADLTSSLDDSAPSIFPIVAGGLGDVYKGRLNDSTTVAIKTIREYGSSSESPGTYQKRAAKEIYTWSKCQHPNVATLLGLAIYRNSLAMISRWEDNGSLPHYLSKHPDADRCQLASYTTSKSICAGLAYLHAQDVVHGDLKGANVLISRDGTPMLIDFGNASLLDATLHFTQTKSGPSFSLRWTAPEILQEKTGNTAAGDIYALGMTILEAFTGEIPYASKKDQSVLTVVLVKKKVPDRPKKVFPEASIYGNILWALLRSCWCYNPKCRPSAKIVWQIMEPLTPETLQEIEDDPEEEDDNTDDDA